MTLKLVKAEQPEPVADIYTRWRAEIAARDWDRVHVRADRRNPVDLPEPRRGWLR